MSNGDPIGNYTSNGDLVFSSYFDSYATNATSNKFLINGSGWSPIIHTVAQSGYINFTDTFVKPVKKWIAYVKKFAIGIDPRSNNKFVVDKSSYQKSSKCITCKHALKMIAGRCKSEYEKQEGMNIDQYTKKSCFALVQKCHDVFSV